MADFYNIKVADKYEETKDTVVITFDIPVCSFVEQHNPTTN